MGTGDEDLAIEFEDNGERGRWVARFAGGVEAELTFMRRSDGALVLNHTGVPTELGGRGIGRQLVVHAVSQIRKMGVKALPTCPFVQAHFKRHPEWRDLVAEDRTI